MARLQALETGQGRDYLIIADSSDSEMLVFCLFSM